jgi:enamine deaminase RidA (YjgF/YER057c/UK114 family)
MKEHDVVIPRGWERLYEGWHYAPAVRDGDHLRCSGIIGVGSDGEVARDPQVQFTRAFELVGSLLDAAGATFSDVVELTTFHVRLQQHWKAFMQVKDGFVHRPYPAWTAVGVAELARPDALVEIKVVARLPGKSAG